MEYIQRKLGAEDRSFETILASGVRSAMPHGVASDKKIQKEEFITMDFGAYYNGYVSDMTRTVYYGNNITEKHKEIYNLVLEAQILGVNSKVQLAQVDKILRNRKNTELMDSGVILINPDTTYIEDNVEIGQDTVIYPNVTIQGNTKIGKNCEILGNTRIENSVIADNVRIEASVVEQSTLEEGVTVGPFAHLRPKAYLKQTVHVGNFVEIKNSTLEKGVKTGHLTYIGDAEVGEDTNIGAGTITCNYDGKNKHKTKIGKNAFIGSNSIIVAPVEIGNDVLTAAGSVITKNIPDEALAFGRSKQVNKEKK